MFFLNGTDYISTHGIPRIIMSNRNDIVSKYDTFPEIPGLDLNESTERMYFLTQSLWDIRPDGKKMIIGTTIGSILEILDIENSGIKSSVTKCFQKPIFDIQNGQIVFTNQTIFGFACISVTDKYIYATIHGISNPTEFPRTIYVFDWNGNLKKKFNTGRQICTFAADQDNSKLYALAINEKGEPSLGYFSLHN